MIRSFRPGDSSLPPDVSRETLEELAARIRTLETQGYRVEPWIVPPGTIFRSQMSNQDKILTVLRGTLRVEFQEESRTLGAGGTISIPHAVNHTVLVEGVETVYAMVAHRDPPPIPQDAFREGRVS